MECRVIGLHGGGEGRWFKGQLLWISSDLFGHTQRLSFSSFIFYTIEELNRYIDILASSPGLVSHSLHKVILLSSVLVSTPSQD